MTEPVFNPNSILDSTKKLLNLDHSYDVFDRDIITHINSVFGTLHQLGIGPAEGFEIEDASTEWDAFLLGDMRYAGVKTLVYQKVRLAFDPPPTSFAIAALEKQIAEAEYRLNMQREGELWEQIQAEKALTASATQPEY